MIQYQFINACRSALEFLGAFDAVNRIDQMDIASYIITAYARERFPGLAHH